MMLLQSADFIDHTEQQIKIKTGDKNHLKFCPLYLTHKKQFHVKKAEVMKKEVKKI